jgi:prepilin-type processing-associated H-X9-DG protein/prepilin-type N-terminal cleavage/methylation domain-containing protein
MVNESSGLSTPQLVELNPKEFIMNQTRIRNRADRRSPFTLIELLVVIAIIAILAAMLLPALGQARDRGHQISCANQIRQQGMAMMSYADDYEEYFTPNWDGNDCWLQLMAPYIGFNTTNMVELREAQIFSCPSARTPVGNYIDYGINYKTDYGIVWSTKSVARGQLTHPTETIVLSDRLSSPGTTMRKVEELTFRHGLGANYLFADGHVEKLNIRNVDGRYWYVDKSACPMTFDY